MPGANTETIKRSGNSYDAIRFLAATAVLFSHHFALSGRAEPPVPLYGEDFGKLAVEVFFALSGFLIARSLQKTTDLSRFAAARVLRIYPNLLFALVSASAVTLVYFDNYGNWIAHLKYVYRNLFLFIRGVQFDIPGTFQDAVPVLASVNVPLWSLPIEIRCYVLLFLVFRLPASWRLAVIMALLAAMSLPYAAGLEGGHADLYQHSRLGCFFFAGALLAYRWDWIGQRTLSIGLAAIAVLIALKLVIPFDSALNGLALAAIVICAGSSRLLAWFARGGDASYGIYIFAWPVQKFCILLIPGFWNSMAVAFVFTVAIGYATWHLFEKRCMSKVDAVADRIRNTMRRLLRQPA